MKRQGTYIFIKRGIMSTNHNSEGMETRLWDYIDGLSSNEEKTVIEQLLEDNREWKEKYHELLDVHQLMQSSELEHPSMRFSKNVMEEISRLHIAPAAKTYINKNIIRGIVIFFVTTMLDVELSNALNAC